MRRFYERLISTVGFPILVRRHLYIDIESGPRWLSDQFLVMIRLCISASFQYADGELIWSVLHGLYKPCVDKRCKSCCHLKPVSLTIFRPTSTFNENFPHNDLKKKCFGHNKILHLSRRHCRLVMCRSIDIIRLILQKIEKKRISINFEILSLVRQSQGPLFTNVV